MSDTLPGNIHDVQLYLIHAGHYKHFGLARPYMWFSDFPRIFHTRRNTRTEIRHGVCDTQMRKAFTRKHILGDVSALPTRGALHLSQVINVVHEKRKAVKRTRVVLWHGRYIESAGDLGA